MIVFEYKMIPAPKRGKKAKGLRSAEDRFANAMQIAVNEQAAEGWEYMRADTLPQEERQGLGGRKTLYQTLLVFRRMVEDAPVQEPQPTYAAPQPPVTTPVPVMVPMTAEPEVAEAPADTPSDEQPEPGVDHR